LDCGSLLPLSSVGLPTSPVDSTAGRGNKAAAGRAQSKASLLARPAGLHGTPWRQGGGGPPPSE
jgi:hypothetical protein